MVGEPRGDLKPVEEESGLAGIDTLGTQAAKDLVERDLNATLVFDGRKQSGSAEVVEMAA